MEDVPLGCVINYIKLAQCTSVVSLCVDLNETPSEETCQVVENLATDWRRFSNNELVMTLLVQEECWDEHLY